MWKRPAVRSSPAIALLLIAVLHDVPEAAAVDLEQYERSVFSQGGEDGVIEKIFLIIEPTTRFAVEFGAGDGVQGSNVRNLFLQGWRGFQIEGNPKQFRELQQNYGDLPQVKNLLAWVWPGNIEWAGLDARGAARTPCVRWQRDPEALRGVLAPRTG